ncbi:uncharacterized protein DDB_G0287625-like [Planococcus citri]|uniref:uncharacterized protein DDB_G0287625-like n=1 Tax=Planococcus citri TaxID=170843 RepID=UPI0031F870B5
MDSEDDIYDDLPQETTTDYIVKIENELESVQQQYKDAQKLIEELSGEKYHLQKRIEELAKKVEDLERNISSLFRTAVAENKRKDNLLHELRVENDDLAFRRREHRDRSTNRYRNRSLDRGNKGVRETYHKDGSPIEEKYRYRSHITSESAFPTKKPTDRNGKYDEKHRIEKRNSSERNERRSNEYCDQEKYRRSRTKSNEFKERHSRSPRDRVESLFEAQTYSERIRITKKQHRRSQERYPKSLIKCVIRKRNTFNPKTRLDDASSSRNTTEPQNSTISYKRKHLRVRTENTSGSMNGSEVQSYSEHISRKEHQNKQETRVEHHDIKPVIKENTANSSPRLDGVPAATSSSDVQNSAIPHKKRHLYVRVENTSGVINGSEVQSYSEHIVKKEHQDKQEARVKHRIKSVTKENTADSSPRLDCVPAETSASDLQNSDKSSNDTHIWDRIRNTSKMKNNTHGPNTSNPDKRHRIEKTSSEKKDLNKEDNSNPYKRRRIENTSSGKNDSNEQGNSNLNKNLPVESTSNVKNDTNKPNIPSLRENDQIEITLNVKNDTNKPNIPNLHENDRTEIKSSVKNDTDKPITSSLHKSDRTENTPSMKNDSNKPNTSSSSNLDKNVQIQNSSHLKNDTNISNPARNDRIENTSSTENKNQPRIPNTNKIEPQHNEETNHKSIDISNNLAENALKKFIPKTPGKTLIDDILEQRNCKAAFLSMKKQSWKLVSPMKETPDLLKEKFTHIENNKIDAKIPMINEQRMLSPFKNVGIVQIISRCADEVESTEESKFETIAACSVTISEDVEHGVFARKSRKRPRIQKIVTGVKKIATC